MDTTSTQSGPAGPAGVAAISLSGLIKTFSGGSVKAVDGLNLTVNAGEIVAFLGPNGAGKTTTLDMLLGLTEPSSGTVSVLGGSPRQAVNSGRLAAVLQTGGLLGDLKVGETVRAIAALVGGTSRVDDVMSRADLTQISGRRVSKCSGGEQQRVKFALALLSDPDVLVLDEPTAGMDVNARRRFWETMREDADAGRTIVFATHYLEEAEQFARRTVLVAHGKIVADAPTEKLRASLGGRTVAATVPSAGVAAAVTVLRGQAGVSAVEHDGSRLLIHAQDSDAVARLLLTQLGGSDLEITAPTLENAFTALTQD